MSRLSSRIALLFAWLLAATVAGAAGCVGQTVDNGSTPGNGSGGPGGGGRTPPANPVADFVVPTTQIKLLSFSVRLARIASVTGVPVSDPLYNTLRDNRLDLGDHDYANAKPPQDSWSAARLHTWVESIRPLCQAPAVKMRLGPMPQQLGALVEVAFGRAPLPDDGAAITEGLAGLKVPPDKVAETACVAVMSSLEFVAQ
jgi:hypothetical protein